MKPIALSPQIAGELKDLLRASNDAPYNPVSKDRLSPGRGGYAQTEIIKCTATSGAIAEGRIWRIDDQGNIVDTGSDCVLKDLNARTFNTGEYYVGTRFEASSGVPVYRPYLPTSGITGITVRDGSGTHILTNQNALLFEDRASVTTYPINVASGSGFAQMSVASTYPQIAASSGALNVTNHFRGIVVDPTNGLSLSQISYNATVGLQAASASQNGAMTTGTQQFAGQKYWYGNQSFENDLVYFYGNELWYQDSGSSNGKFRLNWRVSNGNGSPCFTRNAGPGGTYNSTEFYDGSASGLRSSPGLMFQNAAADFGGTAWRFNFGFGNTSAHYPAAGSGGHGFAIECGWAGASTYSGDKAIIGGYQPCFSVYDAPTSTQYDGKTWQGGNLKIVGGLWASGSPTKGDLIAFAGTTTGGFQIVNLLNVGTDGYVLTADAASTNGVKWAAASTGSGATGTVTTVSVVNANGFDGSVATATTTPAITLTTTVTGILKGNGTAISAATPGVDYGMGTVTSVSLTAPPFMTQSGSPVTSSGTLALSWQNQSAGVFAAPTSGAGQPSFRALAVADLPTIPLSKLATTGTGTSSNFLRGDGVYANVASTSGTVTSVDMTVPSALLAVSGNPITSSGTFAVTLPIRANNLVFAGPSTGGAATPFFRSLVSADLPPHQHASADIVSGTIGTARLGSGSASATTYLAGDQTWKSLYEITPSGGIMMYGGSSAPTGYLLCDGSAVSRTTYANLYTAIGTAYGAGDGATTFNVPDMRSRLPIGYGAGTGLSSRGIGNYGGNETHTLSTSEIPAHSHAATAGLFLEVYGAGSFNIPLAAGFAAENHANTANAGGGGSHNNMPPWLCVNFIIKH